MTSYPNVTVAGGMLPCPYPVTLVGGSDSGGLTDTELRASPISISGAVTGTFFQTTQPVSLASTVNVSVQNGSLAVTGAFYPATQPVSGTVSVSGSVGVTGSFYQATQPVSIASMPTTPVMIASMPSTPVTGSFWQTTQPVSGTFWQATQPVSGTVTITPPTLTKGTQGSTGVSSQDLKDAGRAIVNAATAIAGVTAVTTEALLALNVSRDGAATASATTIAVTSGKRLRIIGVVAGVISTAAAVISARVSLRLNPNGAASASSPILATLTMSQQAAALAQAGDTCVLMFPEAIEISGTMQVGLSQVASVTTGTIWASLIGYEY